MIPPSDESSSGSVAGMLTMLMKLKNQNAMLTLLHESCSSGCLWLLVLSNTSE